MTTQLDRRFHPEIEFGGFTDLDGAMTFYARVQELLRADGVTVDVGCGRGTQAEDPVRIRRDLRILRGKCRRVIGLDVDAGAATNQFIDEFRPIGADGRWPIEDRSVDLALADFVLEHVREPRLFFSEAARVLAPGGHLCIRTINAWSYVGFASRAAPNQLHRTLLRAFQPDRPHEDIFDTYYRCNTVRRIRAALHGHGFTAAVYGSEAEPAYLTFSPLAYRLGLLHRRLAPSSLRVGIFAWARRVS